MRLAAGGMALDLSRTGDGAAASKTTGATMKLGKAISVEHIKRMTLRTVRESNEGQPEFLAFMNALERNDFDENLCKREARHLEQVMTTKVRLPCCLHVPHLPVVLGGGVVCLLLTLYVGWRMRQARRQAAEHRSTLNFHVIRMMKGLGRGKQ